MTDTFYGEILGKILFHAPTTNQLLVVPGPVQDGTTTRDFSTGSFNPESLVRGSQGVHVLPDGEGFVDALDRVLKENRADAVFVFSPSKPRRFLSEELREKYPQLNLEEIVLQFAAENLAAGSLIGLFVPQSFFVSEGSRGFREKFLSENTPKTVAFHDFDLKQIGLPFHDGFRAATLITQVGSGEPLIRLFRMNSGLDAERAEIISDLDRLMRQQGGRTKFGYIIREGLPPGTPLRYELYEPDFRARQKSVEQVGETKSLSELVDISIGIHRTLYANLITDAALEGGVPLIEGMNILPGGGLAMDDVRHRILIPPDKHLHVCDICIRTINPGRRRLCFALIREDDLPAAASESVILLRPKATTTSEQRDVLVAYLGSPHAAEYCHACSSGLGSNFRLNHSVLADMPVPVPDEAMTIALQSLNEASRQFNSWSDEANRSRNSLFEFASIREARTEILSMGRASRRRVQAALLVNDSRYRVRTMFPHPIAFRWRTVEASHSNLEGYQNAFECIEVTICYIAVLVILHSRLVEGSEIKGVREIAKKLTATPHGTSLGDWVNIIREARDSKSLRAASETTPFFEAANFLRTDTDANAALQRLIDRRNDHSHGRGPKGNEVDEAFVQAKADLEQFLQSSEFLAEYPLRLVEWTRRDSMRKVTFYEFRNMMGDHPLVPLEKAETDLAELESQSLYLVDRNHRLHLVRPFLNMLTCPVCQTRSTFYLDRFDRQNATCLLKSLEHGHTAKDASVVEAFRQVGLL